MNISRITIQRGVALMIDLMISTFISMALHSFLCLIYNTDEFTFVMFLGILLLITRDIFGRSIGKYMLGLQIIDVKTNSPAKLSQRLLRNITAPITSIEALILIAKNNNRRFGDVLAGTTVEETMNY